MSDITRRKFLGETSCAAVGTISMLSTLLNLKMANRLAAADLEPMAIAGTEPDYKSLVCLFQAGGNDSFNVLIPNSTTEYDEYVAARSNLAIGQSSLNALDLAPPITGSGTEDRGDYGIHPSLGAVADMFNGTGAFAGKRRLSFVANIGTLVEPTTKAQYLGNGVALPRALFSHVDQIEQWQTAIPQGAAQLSGWAGRAADVLHSTINVDQTSMQVSNIPMNISLNGRNAFQTGVSTEQFVITPGGGLLFTERLPTQNPDTGVLYEKNQALESMLSQQYDNLIQQTYADLTRDSVGQQEEFQAIFDNPGSAIETALNGIAWPGSYLATTLRASAKTIAIRERLGLRRQTLFVQFGGWDHHAELLVNQAGMLTVLSQAVSAFQLALEALGIQDDVITFTASDFGRTLRSNGRGTDHAWGGNQMVFGGGIQGGHVFGSYPSLVLDANDDIGRGGRILPSTPVDGLVVELLKWFGVSKQNMTYVLPNIENFYDLDMLFDPTAPTHPLGLLA